MSTMLICLGFPGLSPVGSARARPHQSTSVQVPDAASIHYRLRHESVLAISALEIISYIGVALPQLLAWKHNDN